MSRISHRFSAVSAAGSEYRLERQSPSSSHCRRTPSSGWPASTSSRSCSGERADFFFEPLQLHLEPADLLEQFRLLGLGVGNGLGPVGEDLLGAGQELLLPA